MKVFLDTNVLVAACVAEHEHHARALPLVQSVHDGKTEGFVSGHSLLEAHAVLTRLPRSPRLSPAQASSLISANIIGHFSVIALNAREYAELSKRLGAENIHGGRVYDLLHLECAKKSGAEKIFTFNVHDFSIPGADLRARITAP